MSLPVQLPFAAVPLLASFALPIVAAGAAATAVALPVLIHLLSRQRYQIVPWAAMRFLLAAQRQHRRRIDRWLLLAARMLVLLLPLMAMVAATPWAESLWQAISPGPPEMVSNAPRTHRILVLDTSLSMSARAGDRQPWETALAQVEQAIRSANTGDGFTLITVADSAQVIIPGPVSDPEKVLAEVARLKPTHATTDLAAGFTAVADALTRSAKGYPRRQVLLFTDLQRSAWRPILPKDDAPPPEVWQQISSRSEIVVVDAATANLENLAIVDLSLVDSLPLVDAPLAIQATIQNFGKLDRKGARVELQVGRPSAAGPETTLLPQEQRLVESIPAGQRVTLTFVLEGASRFREAGLHLIQLKLVDPDDLPADDQRTLAIDVREGLSALLVNGKPSSEPFRKATDYLQEALSPGGRPIPGNPARPRVVSLAEFADPALSDLSNVDCVFLCDVPMLTAGQVSRLEAHLKRGGGVVIGFGPNVAANLEAYNRLANSDGSGLLPGKLLGVATPDEAGVRLHADEESYRRPPLAAFRDDNARAGLTSVPFKKYIRLDAPVGGRARRIASFITPGNQQGAMDPAVVEWPRHRGRVVIYTSTFNTDWTDWPVLPSYLPFVHEVLRFASTNPDRHTVLVGEPIEEFVPVTTVGLSATVTGPDGLTATVPIVAGDEVGVARFTDTLLSGVYRLSLPGRRDRLFAVNIASTSPGGGSESDLTRIEPAELKPLGTVPVVTDPNDTQLAAIDSTLVTLAPRPHGPTLARWLLTLALVVVVLETWLAWRLGPSRSALSGLATAPRSDEGRIRLPFGILGLIPLLAALSLLGVLIHAQVTGDFLGFVPESWRWGLERFLGVPVAGPGEGIRWRLESIPAYLRSFSSDRSLRIGIMAVAALGIGFLYWRERRTAGSTRRILVPFALRVTAICLIAYALLPQVRLAFDREGWPDVAILIDTSASMSTVDTIQDPEVRQAADKLRQISGLSEANRLQLARALLTRPDQDVLARLLSDRQLKVHVYSIGQQSRLLTQLNEPGEATAGRAELDKLVANEDSSRLGDCVEAVLKSFRGGSLAGMIVLTDGVTTSGTEMGSAGRSAGRAGVPLFIVGLGDTREPRDLILSDLKVDDVVLKNDRLPFEVRLTSQGPNPPKSVPVVLYERQGETLIKRDEAIVQPDPSGKPITVRLATTPTEVGEKTYVIDVPVQPEESETGNNRLERVILVTESKKLRVLYIEGYPRYEFRFVKALLEREKEATAETKSFDLGTLLLDASPGYAEQDRSALRSVPTRSELFEYDVVIVGDIDPAQLPKAPTLLQDLADFVKVKGGGMLFVAGEQATPAKLLNTPLADLLPVLPADGATPRGGADAPPILESYRPKPTQLGTGHPLFRLATDDTENTRLWAALPPLFWYGTGYKRKQSAEVLATHPERPADGIPGENQPLVLQQFVGSGRVLFFGFDETWRWRFREGERLFDQFWEQTVRTLARNRVVRAELKTDKQTAYRRDEPIRLTVRFPDDAPAPQADTPVRVSVERSPLRDRNGQPIAGGSEAQTVQLAKVEGTRATYQTLLTRTPEGEYRFFLTDPAVQGTKPRAEAKVLPPPGEKERLEMNRTELMRAATESRGKFYTLANADRVVDDLPDVPRVPLNQPVPPIALWNHLLAFVLFATLIVTEWLLRRRDRLL